VNAAFDSQFPDSQFPHDDLARAAMRSVSVNATARGAVVNRTHRVVRERAKVIQARRSRVRSLMVPLIVCSALLILSVFAVWTGLYQSQQAAEAAVQADVTALADSNNHFLVVLLWFVPVSIALLSALWVRHSRNSADGEAR
jgi:type VI protein secretion system component VasK